VPDREHRPRQLARRQHVHDVALVLVGIGTPRDVRMTLMLHDPRMVTGCDRVEAQHVGALAEPVELQVPVALDARVGCRAVGVRVDVRLHDVRVEVVGEVEDEVIDAELLRHSPRIVDIGDGTATGVAGASPQAHGQAHDLVARVEQFERSDG
jgi:hypothetical protein